MQIPNDTSTVKAAVLPFEVTPVLFRANTLQDSMIVGPNIPHIIFLVMVSSL
jgi:hypothetical protein